MTLKNYLFTTLILSSILFFSACADTPKSKAKDIADKICEIATDIGVTDIRFDKKGLSDEEGRQMEKKFEQNKDKILSLLEEVDTYIKTLDKDQKVQFSKELMKAIIDTDCANLLFKNIPFDMCDEFYSEARKELKRDRKEERRDRKEEEERRDREEAEQRPPAAEAPAPYEGEAEFELDDFEL